MPDPTSCCRAHGGYCPRCDLLVDLPGLHVTGVERAEGRLRVQVESRPPTVMGCPSCGVVAHGHGRQLIELIDAPCFTTPVRVLWRKRRWRCPESSCPVTSLMEQDPDVAPARGLLTCRATGWAIGQMRRENESVQGLARQLGCSWKTLWRSIRPVLAAAADDEARFAGVTSLGVDEHLWHHVSTKPVDQAGRGPKEFTGMVDLTRDKDGRVRARLLDLVPGPFRRGLQDVAEGPRRHVPHGSQGRHAGSVPGYKNAIDDQLADAVAVVDAFYADVLVMPM